MRTITLDIETIPCQLPALQDEIREKFRAHHQAKADALRAEAAALKPPANFKDPVKIADWEANTKPGKKAALEAEAAGELAQAEQKFEDEWRRTSFDGALGQIVVIGYAIDNEKPVVLHSSQDEVLTLAAEAKLLRTFYAQLGKAIPANEQMVAQWVGHNILDFDFRFLFQRSVIHGIKPLGWIPFDAKPWGDRVFDTMHAWAGNRGRVGQDKLCRVLGIDAKGTELGDEIDGSRVWDFVKEGRIADVATYCGGDVNRARELFQRLTFAAAA